MNHQRLLGAAVVLFALACGAAAQPAGTTARAVSEAPPSVAELTSALHIGRPIDDAAITMAELDGAPPREAVMTGNIASGEVHHAYVWILRHGDEGWSAVASEMTPLDDPGTFEASPGASTLHVMHVDGSRDVVFVRFENAQGGYDPRTFDVEVAALVLDGDRLSRAWHCRTTSLVESGPERETVSDEERAITFDDEAQTLEVVESSPTAGRALYSYANGRWSTDGANPCGE